MRKIVGRAAATAVLTAVALLPLAGAASAAPAQPSAQPSAADRCWVHHGHMFCTDGPRWHPHHGLLDLDVDLDLL
ncbi:hypothetical protein [Streptomyces sp. NPDC048442]|uniref:hypothetical protein n=1 Tax=Streptomyces sp. NPDC048442 TaxID=3154823 RepID=UPI0034322AF8